MKDQDNKTSSICYCKNNKAIEQDTTKSMEKQLSAGDTKDKIDRGNKQPWSMFEGWYWL